MKKWTTAYGEVLLYGVFNNSLHSRYTHASCKW